MDRIRVFVTPHAQRRIEQRGGDVGTIASAARRVTRRVAPWLQRPRRLAVDVQRLPEVIPVIEIRPARRGKPAQAVVKTVLPPDAHSLRELEVVYV